MAWHLQHGLASNWVIRASPRERQMTRLTLCSFSQPPVGHGRTNPGPYRSSRTIRATINADVITQTTNHEQHLPHSDRFSHMNVILIHVLTLCVLIPTFMYMMQTDFLVQIVVLIFIFLYVLQAYMFKWRFTLKRNFNPGGTTETNENLSSNHVTGVPTVTVLNLSGLTMANAVFSHAEHPVTITLPQFIENDRPPSYHEPEDLRDANPPPYDVAIEMPNPPSETPPAARSDGRETPPPPYEAAVR